MKVVTLPYSDELMAVHALAGLLEKLEGSPTRPDGEQYRSVVRRLTEALSRAQSQQVAGLDEMLQAHPAAAQLYENLNYEAAGLCRAPVEAAIDAELAAQRLLQRLRGQAPAG